jgi:tetratricopeptide (TPR) repeat protein
LTAAEASGDLADRDRGIDLGLRALVKHPGDPTLSLRVGRAVRARYRATYQWQDLDLAVQVLEAADRSRGGASAAAVGAELAQALVQLAYQMHVLDLGAGDGGRPLTPEQVVDAAAEAAEAALEDALPGSPERAAALHALGVVRSAQGRPHEATTLLEEALPSAPTAAADLAYALAESGSDERARSLFVAATEQAMESWPRHAFEAARMHGYWASTRHAWGEAAEAYTRALHARARLRAEQDHYGTRRTWLQEAGPIPSQAACAFVRADRPADATAALDAGLALGVAEALGLATPEFDAPPRPGAPAAGEALVYLAFDAAGGVAVVLQADRPAAAVELSGVTRSVLVNRFIPVLDAYTAWRGGRTPATLRTWTKALEGILAWAGSSILEPALALVHDDAPIVLIGDGQLALLPLHAAPVGGAPMLDRRVVRMAPSSRVLATVRARAAALEGADAFAAAAAEAPGQPVLNHVDTEARAVGALMGGDVLIGPAATRAAVEEALDRNPGGHLACHAYTSPTDALESAIILPDGALTLRRLLELRLTDTRLVVLSACETAMQDVGVSEEMISLAGGLLEARVAGVAATLWAVDDRSALLIALRFHELRRGAGADACAALCAAQRWVRDSTAGELVHWLGELGEELGDAELAGDLRAVLAADDPGTKPFGLVTRWAAFAYYGA